MGPGCDCWLMLNDCCDDGCDCEAAAMAKMGRRGRGSRGGTFRCGGRGKDSYKE